MSNMFDDDKKFDKFLKLSSAAAIVYFVVGGLVSLGVLGLLGWAVIRLVQHFTGG